jgi:SAM-dependent methyltransferase
MKTKKFGLIQGYCKGKDVLDLGCIGDKESEGGPLGLFNAIERVAKEVIGVDNNKRRIVSIASKGKKIIFGDAEHLDKINFKGKFDVIVACELIEHLNNFGLFLDGMKKNLKDDGRVIITTPNAFFCMYYVYLLFRRNPPIWPEHTCFFDENTAKELFRRYGYEIVHFEYMNDFSNKSGVIKFLFTLWNRKFGTYLFYVLKKSGNKD